MAEPAGTAAFAGGIRRATAISIWVLTVVLGGGIIYAYFVANQKFSLRPNPLNDADAVLTGLAPIAFASVGLLIILRRSRNLVAWLFMAGGLAGAGAYFAAHYAYLTIRAGGFVEIAGRRIPPAADWFQWFPSWTFSIALALLSVILFLIFPDGRLPSRRWRPAAVLVTGALAAFCLRSAFGPQPVRLREFEIPLFRFLGYGISVLGRTEEIVNVLFAFAAVVAVVSLSARYRISARETRQQLKWFVFAASLLALAHASDYILHIAGQRTQFWADVLGLGSWILTLFLAIATALAVLKYRLYDVDVVISRTLTYGTLAIFITLAYVGLSVGASRVVGDREVSSPATSAMAMGLVALGFAPVRARTQRLANKIVYGERAASYEVLTRFSREAARTLQIQQLLPGVARAAAQGIGAASVAVRLDVEGARDRVGIWPTDAKVADKAFDFSEDIAYRDERIGRIEVRMRRGEGASSEDRKLLELLATHAGAAFQNAKLTFELEERLKDLVDAHKKLKASSRRLVTAQLLVRQSLKEEIDSLVGPHLSRATEILSQAEVSSSADQARTLRLIEQATTTTDSALEELRDIAHGIFSPILEEKGLITALESRFEKTRATVELNVTAEVRGQRFIPGAETAVFFSCVELVRLMDTPVAIHIHTTKDLLIFEVRANSRGIDPFVQLDSEWLQSLGDRLGALGGRLDLTLSPDRPTVVTGRVPSSPTQTVATLSAI